MDVPQFIAGRFRTECEIGRGGMGTVYRATHLGLQRAVAIKIIKSEFAADSDVADRFMREARTMAKLRHQRAAMIFDAGNLPDGRHFIIMEFVEGTTLAEVLGREHQLSAERAVSIAVQVCDVLEEAHRLGIIHRDLKPSNIMLNERGVCVLDFGVAKVLASSTEATASHGSTGSGQIVGTPRYMSPEQCLGQRVGAGSDLYSLGVLLYEMLTGRPPFIDALPSAVLVKQATAPPPPLPHLRPDIPRALALAVHGLLAKQPTNRPKSAAEARAILEQSLAVPAHIEPEIEPLSTTVAAAISTSRNLVFRIAAPLVLVAILGALFLALGYSREISEQAAAPSATPAASVPTAAALAPADNGLRTHEPAERITVSDTKSLLSPNDARRIAASVSHGAVGDVLVVPVASGPAILAVHDERRSGTTHMFMMERGESSGYRISARAPLDTPGFRGGTWKSETLDVEGEGGKQVLFTGTGARDQPGDVCLVLYVPRTRQNYNLRVVTDRRGAKRPRTIWSGNASTPEAAAYRRVLMQRARTLTSL